MQDLSQQESLHFNRDHKKVLRRTFNISNKEVNSLLMDFYAYDICPFNSGDEIKFGLKDATIDVELSYNTYEFFYGGTSYHHIELLPTCLRLAWDVASNLYGEQSDPEKNSLKFMDLWSEARCTALRFLTDLCDNRPKVSEIDSLPEKLRSLTETSVKRLIYGETFPEVPDFIDESSKDDEGDFNSNFS